MTAGDLGNVLFGRHYMLCLLIIDKRLLVDY